MITLRVICNLNLKLWIIRGVFWLTGSSRLTLVANSLYRSLLSPYACLGKAFTTWDYVKTSVISSFWTPLSAVVFIRFRMLICTCWTKMACCGIDYSNWSKKFLLGGGFLRTTVGGEFLSGGQEECCSNVQIHFSQDIIFCLLSWIFFYKKEMQRNYTLFSVRFFSHLFALKSYLREHGDASGSTAHS